MAKVQHIGAGTDVAKVVCVVVHGRSQTQQDMMDMIVSRLSVPDVCYVLPKSDDAGWYEARAIDPLTDDARRQLGLSLDALTGVIADAKAQSPNVPLILVGFSQGACLSTEYLMRGGKVTAAGLLTGCRVGARSDNLPTSDLRKLPIYATGGDNDPWIPATAFHELLGDLTQSGARIRSDMFPGRPHEVTEAEITTLSGMLTALVGEEEPLQGAA